MFCIIISGLFFIRPAAFILFTFVTAALLYVIVKYLGERKKRQKAEAYLNDTDALYEEIRKLRHQYNNMFQAVIFYIENEQWDQIKDFKSDILQKTAVFNNNSKLQLLKIKNLKVRSIILEIIRQCENENISLSLMVSGEITQIDLKDSELERIFQFFMDNLTSELRSSDKRELVIRASSNEEGVSFVFDSTCVTDDLTGRIDAWEMEHSNQMGKRGIVQVKRDLYKKNIIFNNYRMKDFYRLELMIMKQ